MVKKYLIFLMLLMPLSSFAIQIIAHANEKVITDYDIKVRSSLLKIMSPHRMQGKSQLEQEKLALTDLINDVAKLTLAIKNKALASDAEVQKTYTSMLGNRTKLPGFGYDMEYYKEYIKIQLTWMHLIQMRIAPNTNLSEEEIKNYYEELKKTPLIPSTLHLAQLVVDDSNRVDSIYAEVKNITSCQEFINKAADYGTTGSGDMGRIPSNSLAPALQQIFATVPIRKVLQPMPIGQGAIIFMVCARVQKDLLQDTEVKQKIETSLLNQKVEVLGEKYLQDYRDQMYLDIKAEKYKDLKELLF